MKLKTKTQFDQMSMSKCSPYILLTIANKWNNTLQNQLPFDSENTSVALILPKATWTSLCKALNVAEHGISIGLWRQTMEKKRKSSSKKP